MHENKIIYRIIEENIEDKWDRRYPRTSFVKEMISCGGLPSYFQLKMLQKLKK